MTERATPVGETPRLTRTQLIPLAAIVLLAAELRLLFHTGIVDIDGVVYSHLARNVSEGIWRLTYEGVPPSSIARVGLYAPVGLLYALFGASDVTTLAWTFGCSLFGILCAYGIGRRLAGEPAGLMAAFLYAVLPTDVAAATALMGDGPVAGLGTGVVYFALRAESAPTWPRRAGALLLALACLLLAVGNKSTSVLLLVVFLAIYAMWKGARSRLMWGSVIGVTVIGLAGYAYHVRASLLVSAAPNLPRALGLLAGTATDWWAHVVTASSEYAWLAPLWMVASAVVLALRRREAYLPLAWFWVTFLYLEVGSRNPFWYEPISVASVSTGPERHFLLIAVPALILSGVYLAQGWRAERARRLLLIVSGALAAIGWAGTRHSTNLDWNATHEATEALPFAIVSALAIGATIFGSIASPIAAIGASERTRTVVIGLLVFVVGLGSLNLSYRAAATYRAPWLTTFPEVARFLETDSSLPIFVQNDVFGQRLDYASQFHLGFRSTLRDHISRPRLFRAPQDPNAITDAYILIDEYYVRTSKEALWGEGPAYFSKPPDRWAEIARFGSFDTYRLHVYRSFHGNTAARLLESARVAIRGARTPQALQQLMTAATGAREYCEAASAWMALRAAAPKQLEGFDPLPLVRNCTRDRSDVVGPTLVQNGDFSAGTASWSTHPETDATITVDTSQPPGRAWHVVYRQGNWQVIRQEATVQPDTVYIYEADIRSTTPVVSLYWEGVDGGHFLDQTSYPDWTHLRFVFMTPHGTGAAARVGLNPLLPKGPGDAWLKNVRLSEFRPPPVRTSERE